MHETAIVTPAFGAGCIAPSRLTRHKTIELGHHFVMVEPKIALEDTAVWYTKDIMPFSMPYTA